MYGTSEILKSNKWAHCISEEDMAASNRMRMPHRSTWLACRVTLRYLCGLLTGYTASKVVFQRNANGKPFLKDNPFYFSVSHSGDSFLIAISMNSELGVDMEVVTDMDVKEVAEYAFSQSEQRFCENGQDVERFYEVWTSKEAYLKAIGVGLVDNLSEIDVADTELLFQRNGLKSIAFCAPGGEIAALIVSDSVTNIVAHIIPPDFQF